MKTSLILALGAMFLAGGVQAQEPETVQEPNSRVPFPIELGVPGTDVTHTLTGTGIRTKTFLKVKVYAFGLYVDVDGARPSLASFRGDPARDLERDQDFYDEILKQDFDMTLRLVMTRDVGGDDMADAFDGALRPRVETAAEEMDMPGGVEALETFRGFFSVDEVTDGTEIVFSCDTEGTLRTSVGGEIQPVIESPALCWALFDVYLGEKPISKDGKKKVIGRFPELLEGET